MVTILFFRLFSAHIFSSVFSVVSYDVFYYHILFYLFFITPFRLIFFFSSFFLFLFKDVTPNHERANQIKVRVGPANQSSSSPRPLQCVPGARQLSLTFMIRWVYAIVPPPPSHTHTVFIRVI